MLAVPSTSKRSASPDASASCDSKKPKLDTISNTGSNLSTAQLQTELVNLRTQLHSALSSLEETKHERDNSEKWNREMQNTLQRRIDELSEKLRMNREDKERVERELSGERAEHQLAKSRISELEQTIESSVAKKESSNEQIAAHVKSLQQAHLGVLGSLEVEKKNLAEARERIGALEAENRELRASKDAAERRATELESQQTAMFAPYQAIKLGMTQFEAVMARAGPGTPVAPRIANPIAAPMVPTNMAKAVQPPSPEPQEPKAPKQPHYDGEKLILADARASWLRSPNPSGFEAIEPLISSDETKSKIFKLIGSVNRSLSRKQQGWLRASDAGLFLQRAREVEQFDFWPEERGEITIVLDESTKRPRRGGWDRKTRKSSRAVVGEDEEEYVDD